ncbi:MAG: hypothetical protein HQK49_04045 [Oligoflexia bacterium]|nr:hypothetical protein [Oligoflexia bacterium]
MKIKILLITISVFLFIFITSIISIHFLLQSPKFVKGQLPAIQSKLKEVANVDLNFESATIDIFGRQHISELKILWKNPQLGNIELKVKNAEVKYSLLDLLYQKLIIQKISLQNSSIQAELNLPSSKNNTDITTKSIADFFKNLETILNTHLAKLESIPEKSNLFIDILEVKNLAISLVINNNNNNNNNNNSNLDIKNINWRGRINLNNKSLQFSSDLLLEQAKIKTTQIESTFTTTNRLKFILTKEQNFWLLSIKDFSLSSTLDNFHYINKDSDLSISKISFNSLLDIHAKSNDLQQLILNSKSNLSLNNIEMFDNKSISKSKPEIKLADINSNIDLEIKNKSIKLNLTKDLKNILISQLIKNSFNANIKSFIESDFKSGKITGLSGKVNTSLLLPSSSSSSTTNIDLNTNYNLNLLDKKFALTSILKFNNFSILEHSLSILDKNRILNIDSNLKLINSHQHFQKLLALLAELNVKTPKELTTLGNFSSNLNSKITLTHSHKSVIDINDINKKSLSKYTLDGIISLEFDQLIFAKIMAMGKSRLQLKIANGKLINFETDKRWLLANLNLDFYCNNLQIYDDKITNIKELNNLNLSPFLKHIYLSTNIDLSKNQHLNVKKLFLKLGDDPALITLNQSIEANLATSDYQGNTIIKLSSTTPIEIISGIKHSGTLEIPLNMVAVANSKVFLNGKMIFNNFSLNKNNSSDKKTNLNVIDLKEINGELSISEELEIDLKSLKNKDKGIKFAYLIDQNPFERVDFIKLRPLLNEISGIKIAKLSYNNISFGPLNAEININQNMLSLKNFSLIALAGDLSGAFFLDLYPKTLRAGVLVRMTEVNPQLLNSNNIDPQALISARSAISFDLNKKLIEGMLDITKIGKKQLLAMINYIDPQYKNEQLNQTRSTLRLLAPTSVGLSLKQGLLDMDVNIEAIGINKNFNIKSIPISGFIESALKDVTTKINEVPIR